MSQQPPDAEGVPTAVFHMPVDPHVHLRPDNDPKDHRFEAVVPVVASYCQIAGAMFNFENPPASQARRARYCIDAQELAAQAGYPDFRVFGVPLLNDNYRRDDIARLADEGVKSVKLMICGTTTGSSHGVSDLRTLKQRGVFREASKHGMIVQVHCEEPGAHPLEAEYEAWNKWLKQLIIGNPDLTAIVEHVSDHRTMEGIEEIGRNNVFASITYHHLVLTYSMIYNADSEVIDPNSITKPIAKSSESQGYLIHTILTNPQVIVVSDFAPHKIEDKQCVNPASGCANFPAGPLLLANLLASYDAINYGGKNLFNELTSRRAATIFGNKPEDRYRLEYRPGQTLIPETASSGTTVVPLWLGKQTIPNRLVRVPYDPKRHEPV